MVCKGVVDGAGVFAWLDGEGAKWRRALGALAGRTVDVTIRKHREQRSLNQNAYLHAGPLPILADFFGDDIPSTKLALMGECFGWKDCKVTGRQIPVKPHTSDLSVEDCSFFIDWLIPWALTNYGIVLPLPNETEVAA